VATDFGSIVMTLETSAAGTSAHPDLEQIVVHLGAWAAFVR
jgi:hypothetical protein